MANHPERNVVIWELASEEKNLTSGSESFCSFSTTGSTADLTVLEGKERGGGAEVLYRKRNIMLSCSTTYNNTCFRMQQITIVEDACVLVALSSVKEGEKGRSSSI